MTKAACLLAGALFWPSSVSAEIVRLTTGRTLSVETCRFEGGNAVLGLPGGGEVRLPREMVAELLPDEEPYARQAALDALAASTARSKHFTSRSIHEMVDRVAVKTGLDRRLAHAVVRTESNYQPWAISPKGAMGLMQIMPAVAREYSLDDPFDPERNLEAGMRHLRRLLGRFGQFGVSRALAAYNAGEGAVTRYGGVPPYRETEYYVRRIMALLR